VAGVTRFRVLDAVPLGEERGRRSSGATTGRGRRASDGWSAPMGWARLFATAEVSWSASRGL